MLPTPARADNPIVQTNYTADPAPMVHEGRLYLYTSHDEDVTVNNFYTMNDWRLYSTEDMVNWTDHGSPANLRTFVWGTDSAWAPQGIARNGQFYLYVPLNNNTGARIGVGVSNNVAGPFTDPLGTDLAQSPSADIDPTVFIDDDGQAYMYWGNATLKYVTLNEDMISYSGTPTDVALPGFTEGPWFYKRGSLYYMVYAGLVGTEKISYATSDSPTGPWNIRGDIMAAGSTFTNHAGIVDYKGHSYFFYHNSALPGGNDYKRSVCVEEFSYAADGSIPPLTMSADGPAAVATLNPFAQVEAETIAFSSGLKTEDCDDTGGGLNVTQISAGDYIKVKNVDFLDGVTSFEARVSASGNGASIELHLDTQSGTLLGTCAVSGATSWTTTTCPVSGGSGTHDLFLVFTGNADDLFEFNWWKFTGPTMPTDAETGGAVGTGGSSADGTIGPLPATGTDGTGVDGETASSGGSGNGAGSGQAGGGQAIAPAASGSKSQGGSCRVGPHHTRGGGSAALWLAAACALCIGRRRRDARGRLSRVMASSKIRVNAGGAWLVVLVAACASEQPGTTSSLPAEPARASANTGGSSAFDPSGAGTSGGSEALPGNVPLAPPNVGGGNSASVDAGTPLPPEPALITSGPGSYWQEGQLIETTTASADLSVDASAVLQDWLGFGGTFNEAGWDALSALDPAEAARAFTLLFDAREGARLSYGRVPIGASDYALDRYTLSELADDFELESFSIDRDRLRLIPFIQAALAVKPDLQLWASPWTPPAWMKQNNSTDGGRIRNEPEILATYAVYLARFVEEYARLGISVGAVHPQNEPGYTQTYPTCLWTPELLRDFVRDHLGPTFAARSTPAEIWFGTMSAPGDAQHVTTVMADPDAAQYIKGIGVQWNTINSVAGFASSYGVPIMQTEHRAGNYPWEPDTFNRERAPNDHAYAEESWGLITDWINAGVNAYLAWNMVLDTVGLNLDVQRPWPQNALLAVDRATRTLNVTPTYYVFRHLSQFVDPGARRLGVTVGLGTTGGPGTTADGDALAFQNPDGSIVSVVYNPDDAARTMTLGVSGALVQFTIPAHGWATVNRQLQ